MERFLNEDWAVLQELPDNAQDIWNQAFQEALPKVEGDMGKAAAMAWKAFKGQGQKADRDGAEGKAARGMLLVAANGGTPEWIRLAENYGLILNDDLYPCLVDRRAIDSIIASWDRLDVALEVSLEDHNLKDNPVLVVGWIKDMRCRSDGLWIRLDWTSRGLLYLTRKEFGYLSLGFILDESNRPVELCQAILTNYPVFNQWGQEYGIHSVKYSQAQTGRKLKLVNGGKRLEVSGAREDTKQETEGKWEGNEEIRRFLLEVKELLHLHGEISLSKVKQAIIDLRIQ